MGEARNDHKHFFLKRKKKVEKVRMTRERDKQKDRRGETEKQTER